MTTWATFMQRLIVALGDTDRLQATYPDAELLMYVNYGLVALSEHTARTRVMIQPITVAARTQALPADFMTLGPVRLWWNNLEEVLRPLEPSAGQSYFDLLGASATSRPDSYYEYPSGTLNFRVAVPLASELRIGYYAYWTPIVLPGDDLGVLPWMEEALHWNVIAQAMAKPAQQMALLRQYQTKRDAGSPEDNPLLAYANYCRKQYERILSNRPQQDRSGWETLD